MKIAFLTPDLNLRGTCVALYDYAYYNEKILGNTSIIVVPESSRRINAIDVIEKFTNSFSIFYFDDLDETLIRENVMMLYVIKHGQYDDLWSKKIPTAVHCVFDLGSPHGKVYAAVSETLTKKFGNKFPFVPHMINIPEEEFKTDYNLRYTLKIPKTALVFGYMGGSDAFNIEFVKEKVTEICSLNNDIYFIFMNIPTFVESERAIFLGGTAEIKEKCTFIRTCDALLHAQRLGETFGLTIGEFSTMNKPVISYGGPVWNTAYRDILGDKAIYYYDKTSLENILLNFRKISFPSDLNCYKNYTPEKVMAKFKEVFIDPIMFEKFLNGINEDFA